MKKLILMICFSSFGYCFDWNKCTHTALSGYGLGFVVSTTSYLSSVGNCSMIGQKSHDRKVFIALNSNQIIEDIMIGDGEYFNTFAKLSGCSFNGRNDLVKELRSNYSHYFGKDLEYKPSESLKNIDKFIQDAVTVECNKFNS